MSKRPEGSREHDEGTHKKHKTSSTHAKISMDDYKAKNKEFCAWLKKKKDIYFDTLSTEEAMKYFAKFVRKWNDGDLSDKFYDGHYSEAPESAASRTGYKWGFAKALDRDDQRKLESIRGHIHDGKEGTSASQSSGSAGLLPLSQTAASLRPAGPRQGPMAPDREDLEKQKKDWDKKQRDSFYKRQKDDLEELVPKETGRDAKLDKRRAANAARSARDASPEMSERNVMGDNFDIHAAVRRKKEAEESRMSAKRDAAREKLLEHQEKERQKMAELLQFARAARSESSMWQG